MKALLLLLFILPSMLYSQQIAFETDNEKGELTKTYLLEKSTLFIITDSVEAIYIFPSVEKAKEYLTTLDKSLQPKKHFKLSGTDLYVQDTKAVNYYTTTTPSGTVGQIKSVNGTTFTYANNSRYHRNADIIGRLTKIGNIKITYWTDAGHTEKGKYRGKLKSIGSIKFKYEGWTSWGEKAGMVGKITQVGKIQIGYYETDYDKGFKGKLKSIGKVTFSYFKDTFKNGKAGIVGKFREQNGKDDRIIIH